MMKRLYIFFSILIVISTAELWAGQEDENNLPAEQSMKFKISDAPISDVLEEYERLSGNKVEGKELVKGTITYSSKKCTSTDQQLLEMINALHTGGVILRPAGANTVRVERGIRSKRANNVQQNTYAERKRLRSEELRKLREARRNDPAKRRGQELQDHLR